jgi:hypothetical protein
MQRNRSNVTHGAFSTAGLVLMLLCFSTACICWIAAGSLGERAPLASGCISNNTERRAVVHTKSAFYKIGLPIEQIRVGQRVVTPETTPDASFPTAADPATWKRVSLKMVTTYSGGLVDTMQVQTLQGPTWLAEHSVQVGARVPIPLDLKEMGVEEQLAEVTAVSACPPIETGPGRVVLTTVNHLNTFLFDLSVQGARAPPSVITVTGWHKLYSEDRQAWVSACELKAGEQMRGREGPLTVASLIRHQGTETVYNMTVEDEHQYYVADARLLAHNANCINISRSRYPETAQHIEDAQAAGQPSNLTINRSGANANRGAATGGFPRVAGQQPDEYPPAMFVEGGSGASVRNIRAGDNMGAGASMGNQARQYPDGTVVTIKVVP